MRPVPHYSSELLFPCTACWTEDGCRLFHCCHLGCICRVYFTLPFSFSKPFNPLSSHSLFCSFACLVIFYPPYLRPRSTEVVWYVWLWLFFLSFIHMLSRTFFSQWFVWRAFFWPIDFNTTRSTKVGQTLVHLSIGFLSNMHIIIILKHSVKLFKKRKLSEVPSESIRIGAQKAGLRGNTWLGWDSQSPY